MSIVKFSFPTTIHFGAGARRLAGPHLREQGLARALIVTDKGLAALPLIAALKTELEASGLAVAVYGGVFGNPSASQVMAGAAACKVHHADCVIGVGGGAALDVAKVVGLMATHPGDVMEYVWDHPRVRPIANAIPHFIALPTTSGTGSEVGRSSVISEEDSHVKRVVFSASILAKVVFADPELTLGLPAGVTAATGMDALTHNIESYLSPAYHPLCDGIALEGARIAARSLATAVRDGGNLAARSNMMMSSMMGAIAFQKDLGAVHSCAHALGTVVNLHHGLANALMIEPVLAWNFEVAEAKFDELAHACGVKGGGAAFVPWLHELKAQIGITSRLAQHGVKADHLPRLVELASADMCHQTNPRPCAAADFERLFKAAM
ncbi:MAG: iron-containing alcohol dehydrogenase [Burkholderiaceae bacterium]